MLKHAAHGVIDLFFPDSCIFCQKRIIGYGRARLCDGCAATMIPLSPPLCRCCGMPVGGGVDYKVLCGSCLKDSPPYTRARSFYPYDDKMQRLVTALKFGKDQTVASAIEKLLSRCRIEVLAPSTFVVPVPLHKTKLRQRGFNQAALIARLIFCRQQPLIVQNLLEKKRETVAQASLRADERKKSLKNVFSLTGKHQIAGKNICLVDDVFTTGTTVAECSRTLLAGGAASVSVVTLARVLLR